MAKSERRRGLLKTKPSERTQAQQNRYTIILGQLNLLLDICGGVLPDSQSKKHNKSSLFAMNLEKLEQYADMLLRKKEFWQELEENPQAQAIRQTLKKCLANCFNSRRH